MKKLTALVLAMLMLLGIAGIAAADGAEYKKEVVIGWQQKITTLDPQANAQTQHYAMYKLTHESLVHYNYETQTVEPQLASSWEISEDGLTYTFHLLENVKFSNGETLTADDVVFTYERAVNAAAAPVATIAGYIESMETPDDLTVVMHLTGRNSGFLVYMGDIASNGILNRKALQDDPDNGAWVGTGRWIVEYFAVGEDITYVKNPYYHGEDTPTERLVFKYISDDNARVIAQEAGDTDISNYLRAGAWDEFRSHEDQVLYTFPQSSTTCLWLNTTKEPCDDVYMRLAIAYAINYDNVIIGGFDGQAERAYTNWGPNQFGNFTDWASVGLEPYEYNIEKALEYKAKSKYADADYIELHIGCSGDDRALQAQIIQESLKKIGVTVIIDVYDSATYISYANQGDVLQAGISGQSWAANGDSQRVAYKDGNAKNRSRLFIPETIEFFDQALAASTDEEAYECYKQIQIITHENCPMVPICYQMKAVGMVKGVSGVIWDISGAYDLSGVTIEIQK